jgi:hypothetical protein
MSPPAGNGIVSAGSDVAKSLFATLGVQPVLLVIVLLNVFMITGAAFYLLRQEEFRHKERVQVMQLFAQCIRARFIGSLEPPPERGSHARPEGID